MKPPAPPPSSLAAPLRRTAGNFAKLAGYVYHAAFPRRRWTVPAREPAACAPDAEATPIPRIVWQTNFTDKRTLPLWLNHRHNRRLSRPFEYRHLGDAEMDAYMREKASPRVRDAFFRLQDGAARADLWRVQALYSEGGAYLDVDATLVRPLERILQGRDALYLMNHEEYTNFFMATVPGNPVYAEFLDEIAGNIERFVPEPGKVRTVYYVTGPGALEKVLERHRIEYVPRNLAAVQGAYSNERFQYADRPGSKWKYKTVFIDRTEYRKGAPLAKKDDSKE